MAVHVQQRCRHEKRFQTAYAAFSGKLSLHIVLMSILDHDVFLTGSLSSSLNFMHRVMVIEVINPVLLVTSSLSIRKTGLGWISVDATIWLFLPLIHICFETAFWPDNKFDAGGKVGRNNFIGGRQPWAFYPFKESADKWPPFQTDGRFMQNHHYIQIMTLFSRV